MPANKQPNILYVVDHSYPYSSDGYAVRTHAVAAGFIKLGYRVTVISRLGRLWSRKGFAIAKVPVEQFIDGVRYLFLQEPSQPAGMPYQQWKPLAVKAYQEIIKVFKPDLVIAASNYENAEPVQQACGKNVPFIYEVRGFWELTRATKSSSYAESEEFKAAKQAEAQVALNATHVFTLNSLMKNEIISRGVPTGKIALAPNCLTDIPKPENNSSWPKKLNTQGCITLGYLGSFNNYEGLVYLVRATAQLRNQGINVVLVLVGSDAQQGIDEHQQGLDNAQQSLWKEAKVLGIEDYVKFTGRLNPNEIASIYPHIDIVINPRKLTPVTELVSSLKSIEALAYGKPLLLSDIPPHKELHTQGAPVELFKADDVTALTHSLVSAIKKLNKYDSAAAIAWVRKNRLYVPVLRAALQEVLPLL